MFSIILSKIAIFLVAFILLSASSLNLDWSKIMSFGKALTGQVEVRKEFWFLSTLYLICQFWALPISAANKNMKSKIWTNGAQLSDQVENIVGKGEMARYKQFVLFPQCFQKLMLMRQNEYLWSKGLNPSLANKAVSGCGCCR